MRLTALFLLQFFWATLSFAQETASPQPGIGEVFSRMIPLFIIVFFIFYFLVIKPQEKRLRAQQTLLDGLNKGDQVVTTGGIIARVAGKEKDHILLEISNNVRLKVERDKIVKRYEKPKAEAQTKGSAK